MNSAEASARTIEEAIALAIREVGARRDDVEVEVLQEPKPALLGLGGRAARVRVTRRPTDGALAGQAAAEIMELMGYNVAADVQEEAGRVTIVLEGQELSALTRSHGRALDALEFLVGLRMTKRLGRRMMITLDMEGFRGRREAELQKVATEAAGRAVRERKQVPLEPMDPRDRRTIHLALQHDPRVRTASTGEGENRRVVIHPREPGDVLPNDGLPADEDLEP